MRSIWILFLCFCSSSFAQFWQQQASFPGSARDDGAAFSLGNLHYCGTGRSIDFSCTGDFYAFNATNGTWSAIASLPIWQERQYATGFSYQNAGYILGGENCNGYYFTSFWRYNPTNNTWQAMPDFPGAGRAGAQHFLIGSDLYWVGGRNANGYLNEVWCFHFASNTWQQRSSLPIAGLWRGIGFSSNTKGYVSAGKISEDPLNGWNDSTWAYEPLSDSWHSEPAIDFGKRFYVGAAQQDSLLFVFGGVDPNGTVYSTLQKINLNNLQSELLPSFDGTARKGVMAFVNAGDFYITCGIEDQTRINTSYRVTQAVYTGIQDNVVYQLFPIPSYETIFIRVEPQYIGQWVEIKDQQGRTIDTHQLENTTESISMKDYPTGTYLVCLKGHARTVLKL